MSGSRFDRELEELLASLGELPPPATRGSRWRRRLRSWLFRWQESVARLRWNGIAADQLMLAGIVFIVLAYFLRLVFPLVAGYVGLLGVVAFFGGFGLAVASSRRRARPRWRGEVVSFDRGRVPLTERVRRWFRRRFG
ncbi:MAG: hypothetical protein NTZ05_16530 [Chloroflexi bacterium]|nr:hypothetical protein [Chloroflexota bacterium]